MVVTQDGNLLFVQFIIPIIHIENTPLRQLYFTLINSLDCDPARKELFVATCNDQSPTQRWKFERYNETGYFHIFN
jgi:hypothetical protein